MCEVAAAWAARMSILSSPFHLHRTHTVTASICLRLHLAADSIIKPPPCVDCCTGTIVSTLNWSWPANNLEWSKSGWWDPLPFTADYCHADCDGRFHSQKKMTNSLQRLFLWSLLKNANELCSPWLPNSDYHCSRSRWADTALTANLQAGKPAVWGI